VTLDAEIVAVDRLWDLAALVVKRTDWGTVPFMRLGKNKPVEGDKITLSGFGRAGLQTYREIEGVVVGFCAPSSTAAYDLMVVDVASRNGDSGGPMRSENGLLVGVLFGSDGATHGSHCERIRLFLGPLEGRFPDLIRMILTTYPLFEPK